MLNADATLNETYEYMRERLARLVPEAELRLKAELAHEVMRLKKERGAIILGHNYMEPALFNSVCDIVGDSLELARRAATTQADPIVFCGVRFMAETAKILNPERTVLLPARRAGCSLAEGITADDVRRLREAYPGVPIVTYINTYADVKAEVDVVCTSGNAKRVVESLDSEVVIFLPDEYLARNIAAETGKIIFVPNADSEWPELHAIPSVGMIGWRARCEVHEKYTVEDIENVRRQYPDVVVLAHPECSPEVVEAADFSGSTTQMVRWVKENDAPHYLLLTECSMGDNIIAENPHRDVLRLCSVRCPHMNEITLENVVESLRDNVEVIEVPTDIRVRAKRSLDRMLAIG